MDRASECRETMADPTKAHTLVNALPVLLLCCREAGRWAVPPANVWHLGKRDQSIPTSAAGPLRYLGVGRPVVDGLMLDALRGAGYKGAVISAHDLDVY